MKKIIITLILSSLLLFNFSFAQLEYKLLTGGIKGAIPDPFIIQSKNDGQLKTIFGYFFDLTIGISIALAVILFMTGALGNMFDVDSTKSKIFNKELMKNSVIGLILTLTMYLILQTINPDLVKLPLFSNMQFNAQGKPSSGNGTQVN